MRLDLNLSPEPFQNRNLIYAGILFFAALGIGLTSYNAWSSINSMHRQDAFLHSRAKSEWDSQKGKQMSERLQAEIDELGRRPELAQVAFVNRQIDRRSLSWTRLLDWMEATLPPGVILSSLSPSTVEKSAKIDLSIHFQAKSLDAALTFMRRLTNSPAFPLVVPQSEAVQTNGSLIDYQIRTVYDPSVAPPSPKPPLGGEEGVSEEAP